MCPLVTVIEKTEEVLGRQCSYYMVDKNSPLFVDVVDVFFSVAAGLWHLKTRPLIGVV